MSLEIGRIRARYRHNHNGIDTATLRLRLSHCLGSAELHPPAIPPSAILVVRCLASPVAAQMPRWPNASHRHASWERATRQALLDTYHRAVRPGQGYVPASAEAVVFADEGELLACLALDMSQGQALEHWWWRTLLRTLPSLSSTGLTTLLCRRAAAVPAALHYLARRGQAVLVVQALAPHQAMAVLNAMGQAYGMADFRPGPLRLERPSRTQADTQHPQTPAPVPSAWPLPGTATLPAAEMTEPPPWEAALVPPHLGQEQACLLGIGLSLYDRPTRVRSHVFLAHLHAWWLASAATLTRQAATAPLAARSTLLPHRQEIEVRSTAVQEETALPPVLEQAKLPASRPFPTDQAVEQPEKQPPEQASEPLAATAQHTSRTAMLQEPGTRNRSEASTQPVRDSTWHWTKPEEALQPASQGQTDVPPQTPVTALESQSPADTTRETALHLEHGVQTALGGVLYLINLMCQLDLSAGFAADWALDRQVGSWGILELLGRGLLAGERRSSPADPLWMALAQLGGRVPGELPGTEVQESGRFSLPVAWITPVSSGAERYYWAMQHRWLRVWSAAGYVLVECPRSASPPAVQARAALQGYLAPGAPERLLQNTFDQAPLDAATGPMVTGLNPSLARWLALLLPFLRRRLQLALQPAAKEVFDLAQMLLLYPGRLYVTATHVDLVMRLEEISLPVRLAGLDRNPGWLPDFGRVVLFHFE